MPHFLSSTYFLTFFFFLFILLPTQSAYAIDCIPGEPLETDSKACPDGKTGTCGGHYYCVYGDQGNFKSDFICETEKETCFDADEPRPTTPNSCKNNPVAPPDGYTWKRSCNNACNDNSDCPKNTSEASVNADTSNWCFQNTCMMLVAGQVPDTTDENPQGTTPGVTNGKENPTEGVIFDQATDSSPFGLTVQTRCLNKKPLIELAYTQDPSKEYTIFFDPAIGITTVADITPPYVFFTNAYNRSTIHVKDDTDYAVYISSNRGDQIDLSGMLSVTTPKNCDQLADSALLPTGPLANPQTHTGFCGQPINSRNIPLALEVSWEAVPGAIGYAVRIDEDPTSWGGDSEQEGDTIDNDTLQGENATRFSRPAKFGTSYTWWVHSINAKGVYSNNPVHQTFTCPEKKQGEDTEEANIGAGRLIRL